MALGCEWGEWQDPSALPPDVKDHIAKVYNLPLSQISRLRVGYNPDADLTLYDVEFVYRVTVDLAEVRK